jgi:PHS family inorganic phosphate transporter-like MFS transporter
MMTLVFLCQPLGQLAATLVALIAVARQREGITKYTASNCTGECIQTLDEVWRWIIGVGAIPAVIAVWFRLTIIESPRYTADVGRDSRKALSELVRYQPQEDEMGSSSSSVDVASEGHSIMQRPTTVDHSEDDTTLQNLSGRDSRARQTNGHVEDTPFVDADEDKQPPAPSWRDFKDYFWHGGNLRTLMATSFCWFCVDL